MTYFDLGRRAIRIPADTSIEEDVNRIVSITSEVLGTPKVIPIEFECCFPIRTNRKGSGCLYKANEASRITGYHSV